MSPAAAVDAIGEAHNGAVPDLDTSRAGAGEAAVHTVRAAVRELFAAEVVEGDTVAVACSGGADSLALAAAACQVARRRDVRVHGLVVDHALQDGSAGVAERTCEQLHDLGCADARVLPIEVRGRGGLEAAARRARYTALERARSDAALVLLGHTLDDQAETVLLGLGRGSGPRSIAGMRAVDPPWARPFLNVRRETTEAACAALGLSPWEDPHNSDARFTRVRLRTEVLPLLEDVLQGGVRAALARTAEQIREDSDTLDRFAAALRNRAESGVALHTAELAVEHASVRRRVLREWLLDHGVLELSDAHLRSADAFIGAWKGQGPHALPGGFVLRRSHGRLLVEARGTSGEE